MRLGDDTTLRDLGAEPPPGLSKVELRRWAFQTYLRRYLSCVAAVDENVGRILEYLDKNGLTEDTIVIYTSDQGFFLGEHGWFDKRFIYEESLLAPLIIRYPGHTKPGSVNHDLILNIDHAPTILDLAGVKIPAQMQGRSYRKLLEGNAPGNWRKSMYYTYYENSWRLSGKGLEARSDPSFQFFTPHRVGPHRGVRTERHKLIHYYSDGDYWEFFDLATDPNELRNAYGDVAYAKTVASLKRELERLRREYRDVG